MRLAIKKLEQRKGQTFYWMANDGVIFPLYKL